MGHFRSLKNAGIGCVATSLPAGTIALAIACGSSSGAVAAEMEYNSDWAGFYLGLGGGYFNAESKISGPFAPLRRDLDGGLVGLYTGYNYQIDNVVLGLEADVYLGFGGNTKLAGLPVPAILKNKVGASWAVRGRLGWATTGQFMPYISGGYAGMTNKLTFATGLGSDSQALHGWTIGGGAEYMITPNWLLRLDYQYRDFGERTFFSSIFPPTGLKQKVDTNNITFGAAFKF